MKALAITILIVGLLGYLLYAIGMFDMTSPQEQAEALKAKVQRGMTWQQVADIQPPRQYVGIDPSPMNRTGEMPAQPFDRAGLDQAVQGGGFPAGFLFRYTFSEAAAVQIRFDSSGQVVEVGDALTTRDLLEGRLWQR